jgi:hypothetical protein
MRYCMCMLSRRLQILLDEDRFLKVAREAERKGVSIAAVIREAIDRLPAESERRRAAIAAILSAAPMPVPADPSDLRRELDAGHDRLDG